MKLSQELQPVLLELANLERSQGHGAKKEIPEQAEYDKAKDCLLYTSDAADE